MFRLPVWLTLGIAIIVILYGIMRIRLGLRPAAAKGEDAPRSMLGSSLYRMSPRTHLFVGAIHLLLGAALLATSFGFNPFGGMFGPSTEVPAKDKAPTKTGVPIDKVPK